MLAIVGEATTEHALLIRCRNSLQTLRILAHSFCRASSRQGLTRTKLHADLAIFGSDAEWKRVKMGCC